MSSVFMALMFLSMTCGAAYLLMGKESEYTTLSNFQALQEEVRELESTLQGVRDDARSNKERCEAMAEACLQQLRPRR